MIPDRDALDLPWRPAPDLHWAEAAFWIVICVFVLIAAKCFLGANK